MNSPMPARLLDTSEADWVAPCAEVLSNESVRDLLRADDELTRVNAKLSEA